MVVFDIELIDTRPSPLIPPPDVKEPPSDARRTATGLAYKVLRPGTGLRHPSSFSNVTVHYTGWLYDASRPESKGTQFDSSLSPGRTPFTFTVGARQVIAGWDRGVPGMRAGGQRRLIIPPDLGYGSQGQGPIPGNAALVFDIELLIRCACRRQSRSFTIDAGSSGARLKSCSTKTRDQRQKT